MFKAFYAAVYDRISSGAERAGLSEERHRLLAQAAGATIEIGAGTGLNLSRSRSRRSGTARCRRPREWSGP